MCEHNYSGLDLEIREAGIAYAQNDPKRLQEIRELGGESLWAEELGSILGRSLPRLFQDHFNGEITRESFKGTALNLYELVQKPELMSAFFKGFIPSLEVNGDIMPKL